MTTETIQQIQIGSKIYFEREKRPYTVKAMDERYIIATKPFNARKTCLYTILDLHKGMRGPNNLVFNIYDYTKQEDIEECLRDLNNEEECVEISHRRSIPLDIVRVVNPGHISPHSEQ
jgi:hypothetical protein